MFARFMLCFGLLIPLGAGESGMPWAEVERGWFNQQEHLGLTAADFARFPEATQRAYLVGVLVVGDLAQTGRRIPTSPSASVSVIRNGHLAILLQLDRRAIRPWDARLASDYQARLGRLYELLDRWLSSTSPVEVTGARLLMYDRAAMAKSRSATWSESTVGRLDHDRIPLEGRARAAALLREFVDMHGRGQDPAAHPRYRQASTYHDIDYVEEMIAAMTPGMRVLFSWMIACMDLLLPEVEAMIMDHLAPRPSAPSRPSATHAQGPSPAKGASPRTSSERIQPGIAGRVCRAGR